MKDNWCLRLIYPFIFLTGLTGTSYQVVWQKYLTFIIGAEARSTTLVVAIFLLGLSSGYYYWGKITNGAKKSHQKIPNQKILRIYGFIEIAIGIYALLFTSFIDGVEFLTPYISFGIIGDLILAAFILLIPSFLMGATIPLLTAALPKNFSEVNSLHAKIYGINTLGAFLGPLLCAFIFIPNTGLTNTLFFCGFLNILAGLYFIFLKIDGYINKDEHAIKDGDIFDTKILMGIVFLSGLVTISLEILMVRLISLSIGSSGLVYPLVLSLFILGLGIGSLSLKDISISQLMTELFKSLLFFAILSKLIPVLPYWFSNIRASLTVIQSNYYIYYFVVYCVLTLVLIPMLISMGRLLPLSYGLIKKNGINYGDICGKLYFLNTIGTLCGSLFLGHIILYWLDINHVFMINGVLIILLGLIAAYYNQKFKIKYIILFLLATPFVIMSTFWNRSSHYLGLFMDGNANSYNFNGIFTIPNISGGDNSKLLYFKDGVNTTVSVIGNEDFKSIVVNGKSDGATRDMDLSTVVLLAALPLLITEKQGPLTAQVIGFGTGITAGTLGHSTLVEKVDVLEIAREVIEAAPLFDEYNFGASKNDMINIIESDAYRYFTKYNGESEPKYDIIVSEPSNPWVVGVENLYTSDFMRRAKTALNEDGLFVQWIHSYLMTPDIFTSIVFNFGQNFKYFEIYNISAGDFAIIGSDKPFKNTFDLKGDKPLLDALGLIGIQEMKMLTVLNVLQNDELKYFIDSLDPKDIVFHSRDFPTINLRAAKSHFLMSDFSYRSLFVNPYIKRLLNDKTVDVKSSDFLDSVSNPYNCHFPTLEIPKSHYACTKFLFYKDHYQNLYNEYSDILDKLESYGILREQGLIEASPTILNEIYQGMKTRDGPQDRTQDRTQDGIQDSPRTDIMEKMVNEYLKDGNFSKAQEIVEDLKNLSEAYSLKALSMYKHIEQVRELVKLKGLEQLIK